MDIPVACTLTEDQMRERRRELLAPFKAHTYQAEALPDGYAYMFKASPGTLVELARLVDLERQCCRFLNFSLTAKAGNDAIRLEITGPPESMTMIADFFGF